ncbi:MAG: biopolymer transporter ExbD [Planctomycetaceae bacterium]|nr:biopolymer transporter ExbD [Planctomycetaceae bacterium]
MHAPSATVQPEHLDDEEPLTPHRGKHDEANFDITAMIDLVFMLNIFFMVTTVTAALSEMDLPVVRHCVATDAESAVVVSLVTHDGHEATVYLSDSPDGNGLIGPEEQSQGVREAVEEGFRSGKRVLLIKAERAVKLRDVRRVSAAVNAAPGMELRMAVIEQD